MTVRGSHRARRSALVVLLVLTALLAGGAPVESATMGDTASSPRPVSVLLITAHPDDETMIQMGLFRERGWDVSIALVTNGEGGQVVERIVPAAGPLDDVLVEHRPGPGVWVMTPPVGPPVREIGSSVALAAERRREFLTSQAINGVRRVFFLSGLATSDYEDSWDNGVTRWNVPRLQRQLSEIARVVDPDIIITLNPDETWAHPQHQGLGRIVQRLFRQGRFDQLGQPRPLLYGIREHGWYEESLVPQPGDERMDRLAFSAVLGSTYDQAWAQATSAYLSQSSHPVWFAARVTAGMLPGYSTFDLIRRLDRQPVPGLATLLAQNPADAAAMAALPHRPRIVSLGVRVR